MKVKSNFPEIVGRVVREGGREGAREAARGPREEEEELGLGKQGLGRAAC